MGGMLSAMPKHSAGRPKKNQLQAATDLPPTLEDLGIEKTAAHRHRTMAVGPWIKDRVALRMMIVSPKIFAYM